VTAPLAGRSVVVTRAAEQASGLVAALHAAGATVIEVPVIAIVAPADGGAAVARAVRDAASYDWLVVTSPNGARRLLEAFAGHAVETPVAVIGPGTADALRAGGVEPALVPGRAIAEGLLAAFPRGPGRVLVAQAEQARPVLVAGLRAAGWTVDAVVAYRTVPAPPSPELLDSARAADAITFTSASTVRNYLAAAGTAAVPPRVVCIGPETAGAARRAGLPVTAVADPHTLAGLVDAVKAVLASA
jgi:uroporphyrinogen-III synthase